MVVNPTPSAPRPSPVSRGRPGQPPSLSPALRLAIWSAMAACVAWTLLYQVSNQGSGIPEFVYANF